LQRKKNAVARKKKPSAVRKRTSVSRRNAKRPPSVSLRKTRDASLKTTLGAGRTTTRAVAAMRPKNLL
jgi:hypothetical protein